MRFVAAISQGFGTCLKSNAILLRQKLHRVAAIKIASVNVCFHKNFRLAENFRLVSNSLWDNSGSTGWQ